MKIIVWPRDVAPRSADKTNLRRRQSDDCAAEVDFVPARTA